jgi:AcrR family transcriptional regulator
MAAGGTTPSVRDRLVTAAVRVLTEEGPAAVQARRVAREINASTMAVYHHLGGMPELLRAVADEGFRRLGDRVAAVPATADPVTDICRMALVYRRAAHENRHLYDMMFGHSGPGECGTDWGDATANIAGSVVAQGAYGHIVAGVARAMRAGRIRADDPARVAAQLWTVLHGFVTLELSGQLRHVGDGLTEVLLPLGTNLLIGLGDTRDRAERSANEALSSI